MFRTATSAQRERFGALAFDAMQQAIELRLDDLVVLARPRLQTRAVEHRDPASLPSQK